MRILIQTLAVILLSVLLTLWNPEPLLAEGSPNCDDLTGAWITNIGATVNFDSVAAGTGLVVGSYQAASLPERHFPLTGFVNRRFEEGSEGDHYGVALSFTVSFEEYGGLTNWSGICRESEAGSELATADLIVRPWAEAAWAHVVVSHDLLTRKDSAGVKSGLEVPSDASSPEPEVSSEPPGDDER
ncbi:MAG: avidin/streptavidin family protein [Thermoanaerobaculia bacterium]|nr:avidin/streptavidin family protein [Thermoanaerobaculia bacterium]